MAERYYVDCDLAPGPLDLDGPEAHHLATVCRLRRGDAVTLFNGRGEEYPARVLDVGKRQVSVEVLGAASPQRELGFRLEVAAPLPRGDRADFLIEKLTELGVTSFTPLQTARSVVHPRDAKLERLQRHVIEASKQCGRNVLLRIRELTPWQVFHGKSELPQLRILAHPGGTAVFPGPGCDVVVAVGPEGGFIEEEVAQAAAAGWHVVGLGARILRVETAALTLAAVLGLGPRQA